MVVDHDELEIPQTLGQYQASRLTKQRRTILGVMETARKIICQLRQSFAIDEHDEILCLAGSLLHDLGHGPFSHVFERINAYDHEQVTIIFAN